MGNKEEREEGGGEGREEGKEREIEERKGEGRGGRVKGGREDGGRNGVVVREE